MEIRINKQAQEKQQKEELNRVLVRAKTYANAGMEFFEFKRQVGIGLSPLELIEMVEAETNNTVYCEACLRSFLKTFDDTIMFTIRD